MSKEIRNKIFNLIEGFGSSGSYWTPGRLIDGNTVGWYDSQDLSTITKDGSNFVSRWNDKSGLGHDLLQATGTNQPLWNSTGILFNGIDNTMKASFVLAQPIKLYVILNQKTWIDNEYIIDGYAAEDSDSIALLQQGVTPNLKIESSVAVLESAELAVDTYGIVRMLFNGATSTLQINENVVKSGVNIGTKAPNGISIANNGAIYANIEVKELIIRSNADDAATEALIYNYLKKKIEYYLFDFDGVGLYDFNGEILTI